MRAYSVRDVERVLRLPRGTTRGLIKAGFVKPTRGTRREYRFSFQDLIVLRTARALLEARIPAKRLRRSLESLRRNLPESMPLSGLSISAVGDAIVVRDGEQRWQVDSGQYLLGLDVSLADGVLHVVEHPKAGAESAAPEAPRDWFAEGLALESTDPAAAGAAYGHATEQDPHNVAAWINWGRLLHERGEKEKAARVYRRALSEAGRDPLLLFNHGVLLEDLGRTSAALEAYKGALSEDPGLADCHYNLARLYEALGKQQHAIRHLGQYRRIVGGDPH